MTRGNLSYARLLDGGTAAEFLARRDDDVLGAEPLTAYQRSAATCARAFGQPGAPRRLLVYPLGAIRGARALAVRTTDSLVHAWDLARALGGDKELDQDLTAWPRSAWQPARRDWRTHRSTNTRDTPASTKPGITHLSEDQAPQVDRGRRCGS
jgi:uncharacterized protein (TIGR03086 family)